MEPECSLPQSKCSPPVPFLSQLDLFHTPKSTSWRSIIILSPYLRLVLTSGFFPLGFPTKILNATPLPHMRYLPCQSHSRLCQHNNIVWALQIIKPPIIDFRLLPCHLSLIGHNNHHILKHPQPTLFLIVSDQLSHPHKTKGKIIVLYILIFKFLDSKLEDTRFCTEW